MDRPSKHYGVLALARDYVTGRKADEAIVSKAIVIVGIFVSISVLVAIVIFLTGNIFEGVRAYTRGEGLWAKGQKAAVHELMVFSYTGAQENYDAFLNALAAPLGDKKARLALSATPPDRDRARAGFLQGGNHPDDIDSLIAFYIYFQDISYMSQAIAIWKQGDTKIDALLALGKEMKTTLSTARNHHAPEVVALRQRLSTMNTDLEILENQFSSVLGEGARWVRSTTLWSSVLLLGLFVGIGTAISWQIIKSISRDIAEKASMAQEIFRQSREDPLTGLGNRHDLTTRFDQHIKLAQREGGKLALLYLDLDKFKPVNDTFGHAVGDSLLQEVASIFRKHTRETDILARIGGDEFAIVMVNPSGRAALEHRVARIVEEVGKPMTVTDETVQIGVSVGIAMFPDDGVDEPTLMEHADAALYAAKHAGRNTYRFYDPG